MVSTTFLEARKEYPAARKQRDSEMISFAVRIRKDSFKPILVNDAEVSHMFGVARSTIWEWVDAGEFPEPKRVGRVRMRDGRERSRRTFWNRDDVELFARCRNMAEFRRLKQQRDA